MSRDHGCFSTNWKKLHVVVKAMKCIGRIGNIKGKKYNGAAKNTGKIDTSLILGGKSPTKKLECSILNWKVKMLRDGNF